MHEQSITIQGPDGRWYNVSGSTYSGQYGQPLRPIFSFEKPSYSTLLEALAAAAQRSKFGGAGGPQTIADTMQAIHQRDRGNITRGNPSPYGTTLEDIFAKLLGYG